MAKLIITEKYKLRKSTSMFQIEMKKVYYSGLEVVMRKIV